MACGVGSFAGCAKPAIRSWQPDVRAGEEGSDGADLVVHPRGPHRGHGEHLWPRPGRIFVAARSHTFAQLAEAIDDVFARWDRAHLHEFELATVPG